MRRSLAVTVLAVTAMVALAFSLPLAFLIRSVAEDRATSAAEQEARSLAGVLAAVTDPADTTAVVEQFSATSPRRVGVLLADGAALGDPVEVPPDRLAEARAGQAFVYDDGGAHVVVVPVRVATGDISVAVVAVPQGELHAGVPQAWAVLAALVVALVGLALVLADRLARSTVRSIEHLGEVTRRLRRGESDARVVAEGPPEVVDVGTAVNDLADQIDTLLATEREATADLSHRLRTPLTALQLHVGDLRDARERGRLEGAVEQLTAEVDALITAARRPRRAGRGVDLTDLADVVGRRMAFWLVLARRQGRKGSVSSDPGPIWVPVAEEDLVAAIDALLANIVQHTPAGTGFTVQVGQGDGVAHVVVEDAGPGLESGAAVRRGASGAGSTGLGLDIVRRSAESTGGTVVLTSASGGGTRVELTYLTVAGRPNRSGGPVRPRTRRTAADRAAEGD